MPTQYEDDKTTNSSTEYTKDSEGATEPGNAYPEYEKAPTDDTTDEAYEDSYNKDYEKKT